MLNYRNNINDKYNIKNLNECIKLIKLNSTEFINKGTDGEVYKVESSSCGSAVVKKKIIKKNKFNDIKSFEKECKFSILVTRMITDFICPNFIESKYYSLKELILVMEYANGDSRFLFDNKFFKNEIYDTYLFQTLIGLYCFNNYLLTYHQDMKPANILYKNINKDVVFHYKIKDMDYYVPSYGYLFMIADLGNATFTLDGGFEDLIYFKFKIKKSLMRLLLIEYPEFNYKYQRLFDNFEKDTIYLRYKKINNDILNKIDNFLEDFKKSQFKINNYILEIIKILDSETDIITIFNKYFSKFTKNIYNDKNIVEFTINY